MDRSNLVKSLPDIVRDAKIEAEIYPNQTKNIFYISTRSVRKKRIEELWVRDRELGRGGYGIVHLERCKTDGKTKVRAVKQIRKAAVPGQEFDYLRELEAVMKFSHPKYQHCFVRSDGWYESRDCIFIVMEYLEHGDLQKHLKQPLQEREARLITSQVLEGLRFMHENGFTHRDLKPANIMVVNKGPRWFVKIADFGISKRRHESSMSLQTPQRGTVGFAAPEVFGVGNAKGSYTSVVDMWSLGAVVYTMFTRTTPFPTVGDVCRYARGEIGFPLEKLKQCRITQHCQQFIMSLMVPDARQRLSSSKADKHPWMTIESSLMGSNGSNMRRSYSFRGRERSEEYQRRPATDTEDRRERTSSKKSYRSRSTGEWGRRPPGTARSRSADAPRDGHFPRLELQRRTSLFDRWRHAPNDEVQRSHFNPFDMFSRFTARMSSRPRGHGDHIASVFRRFSMAESSGSRNNRQSQRHGDHIASVFRRFSMAESSGSRNNHQSQRHAAFRSSSFRHSSPPCMVRVGVDPGHGPVPLVRVPLHPAHGPFPPVHGSVHLVPIQPVLGHVHPGFSHFPLGHGALLPGPGPFYPEDAFFL